MAGYMGPPGPPGPQGLPGRPGHESKKGDNQLVVPGAIIFKDMESLLKLSAPNPPGTMAFVLDEEALLVRVSGGWQYVAVSSL